LVPINEDTTPLTIPEFKNTVEEKAWWRSLLLGRTITGVITNTKNNIVGLEVEDAPIYIVNGNGYFGTLMVVAGEENTLDKIPTEQLEEWSKPKGKSPPKLNKSNLPPTKTQALECVEILQRYLDTAQLCKETTLGAAPPEIKSSARQLLSGLRAMLLEKTPT
jgi:hypothetical protein